MLGHLVPVAGGTSIPLARERVYLGRRAGADPATPLGAETALCRLRLVDGWWQVEDLAASGAVRVNGAVCRSQRLKPGDELALGSRRFRILYENPHAALEALADSVLTETPVPRRIEPPHNPPAGVPSRPHIRPAPPRNADPLARLVPVGGGQDRPLFKPRVMVGRNPDCDIAIRHSTVSSNHCELELIDGYWQVRDLGSRNGVRVDGVRCEQAWVLPRKRLSIADLRFELDYAAQGDPPEPGPGDPAYQQPLLEKVGVSSQTWDSLLARHAAQEQDEVQKPRYDLLGNL
jgi:adenylate cyclase